MSLYTDLQQIVTDAQTGEIDNIDTYLSLAGADQIGDFLKAKAAKGKTSARLHFEVGQNPRHKASGFATLSGQLAVLNSESAQGLFERNDIGWVYLDGETLTIAQFQQVVTDLEADYQAEGLTVETVLGAEMAEMVLDWS